MKRAKLQDMEVNQLVERFTAIGIEQDQAILRGKHATFNRLFDEMVAVEDELKRRDGDQRRELLSLYKSSQRTGPPERGEGDVGCSA